MTYQDSASLEQEYRRKLQNSRRRLLVLQRAASNPSLSPFRKRAAKALLRMQIVALKQREKALALLAGGKPQ